MVNNYNNEIVNSTFTISLLFEALWANLVPVDK